jgi:tRNA pseudouridine55 synthase
MNGFLLIDKPKGITSFYCLKILRRIFNMRRIGFVGTLDPLASGLMIFALGEATKLISFLEKSDKIYDVVIHLGAESDTYDAEGDIKEFLNPKKPALSKIKKLLDSEFSGECAQVPPAYSAIQIGGKRAYDMARKGHKVNLKSRPVYFYGIKIKSYKWPVLKLNVHCGSGTYIRSLAHDLGEKLGCGGYVEDLRRTKIGDQSIKNAINPEEISKHDPKKFLIQPQKMLKDFPQCDLDENEYNVLKNGGFIDKRKEYKDVPILALYKGECVGVLEPINQKLKFLKKFNIIP